MKQKKIEGHKDIQLRQKLSALLLGILRQTRPKPSSRMCSYKQKRKTQNILMKLTMKDPTPSAGHIIVPH